MTNLQSAAQAVLDQWDSPAWEWQRRGPTAELMAAMRAALAAPALQSRSADDLEKDILRKEIERLTKAIHYEQHLRNRVGAHGPGCWEWGPDHYECATRKLRTAQQ